MLKFPLGASNGKTRSCYYNAKAFHPDRKQRLSTDSMSALQTADFLLKFFNALIQFGKAVLLCAH